MGLISQQHMNDQMMSVRRILLGSTQKYSAHEVARSQSVAIPHRTAEILIAHFSEGVYTMRDYANRGRSLIGLVICKICKDYTMAGRGRQPLIGRVD